MEELNMEEMRQQLGILKNKLEQQQIVNDRIVRRAMKKNVLDIKRRYLIIAILGVLMIPYGYWVFVSLLGFSKAFWIGTSVFMLICVGNTIWNSKDLCDDKLLDNNMVEAYRKVGLAKKRDSQWLLIGIPMLVVWLGWLVWEALQKPDSELTTSFLWGSVVGTVLGTIIGLKVHFKIQRNYREILEQIEDVMDNGE